MDFLQNVQLAPLTTFGLPGKAAWFCKVRSKNEIIQALVFANKHHLRTLPLGGGSNLVVTRDFPGLVIKLQMSGIEKLEESHGSVLVRMNAGQEWISAVEYCLEQGWHGLENLAMIPGSAGAAPVQNIGAYGVEIAESLVDVQAIDTTSGTERNFSAHECALGYRTSRFKKEQGSWIITSISLRLHQRPLVNTSYKALAAELESMQVHHPTPRDVYEAVCAIRRAKLPDPSHAGNAGSFFVNPVVNSKKFEELKKDHEDLAAFELKDGRVKIAAAWLIDKCGFKARQIGPVRIHPSQPLVLVNEGQATGRQVLAVADEIRRTVQDTFGINLEYEPRII